MTFLLMHPALYTGRGQQKRKKEMRNAEENETEKGMEKWEMYIFSVFSPSPLPGSLVEFVILAERGYLAKWTGICC